MQLEQIVAAGIGAAAGVLFSSWNKAQGPLGGFKRTRKLGEGGFGTVYVWESSEEKLAGKQVALGNVVRHQSDSVEELSAMQQLCNEIAKLVKLRHDNIVEYFGSSRDDDHVYLFMETSIADMVKEQAIPESAAAGYTNGIIDGLRYLHSKNIIHCDIKGSNVLLKGDVAKLADFGLSQHYSTGQSACGTIHMRGTVCYMAPELWEEYKPGKKADVWAVACTIYEMLHQKPPFVELNMIQLPAMTASYGQRQLVDASTAMSTQLKEFLRLLFTPKDERPDAESLNNHPWLVEAFERACEILGREEENQ